MKYQYVIYSLMIFFFMACGSNENNSEATKTAPAPTKEQAPPPKVIEEEKQEPKSESNQADDLPTITEKIRGEFSRIEMLLNQGSLTKKTKEYDCPDDPEGGTFAFFYDGNTLVKVDHSFYMGDHFGQESSYYFKDGVLIFGFHRSSVWTFAGSENASGTPNTKDEMHIQRDYFHKGKIVKQLFKDYTNYSNQKEKMENEVPNQTSGEGVNRTMEGQQLIDYSNKDKLTCEMITG